VSTAYEKVKEFHRVFRQPHYDKPIIPLRARQLLRENLIEEELLELQEATMKEPINIVDVADALGDLLYVVYGAAVEYGIPLDAVFEEIHASNMSKLGADGSPVYRGDGKVVKGPNYRPPDIAKVLGI
jgi:predicted HAD superfamily Cof-like phosphohydrolase